MINILVIGRHRDILETIIRLLKSQSGWNAVGAQTDDEAIRCFAERPYDLVLIGGGVDETAETKLTTEFKNMKASIKIIHHYGGGSGLLFAEVKEALNI